MENKNYKKYISKSYIYNNRKIFIQDIKEIGELFIVRLDGDLLRFSKNNFESDFIAKISTKIDELNEVTFESKLNNSNQKTPNNLTMENNLKTHSTLTHNENLPENQSKKATIKENNVVLKIDSIDVLEGSNQLTEILKSTLQKIIDSKDDSNFEFEVKKAKAITEVGSVLNNNIKNRLVAVNTALKFK